MIGYSFPLLTQQSLTVLDSSGKEEVDLGPCEDMHVPVQRFYCNDFDCVDLQTAALDHATRKDVQM